MGNYTREEVIDMVEEEDIGFIRLQFTDMFGTLKNIAVTARELPRALNNEYVVDCSFITGISGAKDSEVYLHPDPDTFTILPWRPQQGKVARMLCDVCYSDGTPVEKSSRYILKKVEEEARKDGYTCYVDTECEFFLFHTDDNGLPTTTTHEKAGYLDISPLDLGENARRDMVLNLEEMGFEILSSHHEDAPAQHEIDFKYDEMGKMADCLVTFRMAVRILAKRHGLHATFMPKPQRDISGSGLHLHFSVFKDGKNIFENNDNSGEFSEDAYYFIGGLLAHSREMALITNPIVNSYKRLVPGYEAPTALTWTKENDNNALVRLFKRRGSDTRIELRSPDSASNPYLVFAVCLAAGLDGIKNKITPEKALEYTGLSCEQCITANYKKLPETLKEAIYIFERSTWIKELLGSDFCEEYIKEKKQEWLNYIRQVTNWELEEYLYRI